MKDVNKVILLGRLGADPVQRFTKSGAVVVHFSLATSRRIPREETPPSGELSYTEETQWHKIAVWGKQGEACAQYLKKGSPIYLEGSIRNRTYEDKEGATKTSFEIYADTVSFLGGNRTHLPEGETKECASEVPV